MAKLDVVGPAYEDESLDINAQRCVNLYLNLNSESEGAVAPKQLLPTPGLKEMIDLTGSNCRGMIEHLGRLYVVMDNTFQELTYNVGTDDMTAVNHGTITSSSGPVSLASSTTEIAIVDGTANGFIFTVATNTLTSITDVDFFGGDTVIFLDSFFVFNTPGAATMYHSESNDGLTYNALNTATAESRSDSLVAVESVNDELWAFGTKSTEVWYNAANASGFVFSPRSNIVLDIGCAAAQSISVFNDEVYWLDEQGFVRKAAGYQAAVISSRAITIAINSYSRVDDAIAYNYSENGHWFYVLTFPTAGFTWVYDATTGAWHERNFKSAAGSFTRHRSNTYATHERKHFVGDYNSGRIFRQGLDLFDDAGDETQRLRTTRHGNIENKNSTLYYVELLAEAGVGLVTGQGSDPQITLEVSRDGGHTYGNALSRSLGKIGEFDKRIRWDRLGTGRSFTLRFTVSDPVKVVIIDASAEIAIGT